MALDAAWTFYDPLANCAANSNGQQASIAIPAGAAHDLWTGALNAPRITQLSDNTDFELATKIDSPMSIQYQTAGIVVEQDHSNLIRFDFFWDGAQIRAFCASFVAGSPTTRINAVINGATFPVYLHVKRAGNNWTYFYSFNGLDWVQAVTFNHTLTVTAAGLFAAIAGTNPAFTALFDYYFVDEPMTGRQATLVGIEEPDYGVFTGKVGIAGDMIAEEYDIDQHSDFFSADASVIVSGALSSATPPTDNFSGSATVKITGVFVGQETPDSFVGSAFVSPAGDVVGSLLVLNPPQDSAAMSAQVAVSGHADVANFSEDYGVFDGSVAVTGNLAATDSADAAAFAAGVEVSGAFEPIDLPDTAEFAAGVQVSGSLQAQASAADTAELSGSVTITGNLIASEPTDTFVGSMSLSASCVFSGVEPLDTFGGAGKVAVTGNLLAVETMPQANFTGIVRWPDIQGFLLASPSVDHGEFAAGVAIAGTLSAEPVSDSAFFDLDVIIAGFMDASPSAPDTADFWIENPVTGQFIGIENNDTLIASGIVRWPDIHGVMLAMEGLDDAVFDASVAIAGSLSAAETQDAAAFAAQVAVAGDFVGIEIIPPALFKLRKNTGWLVGTVEARPAISSEIRINYANTSI